ncbi:hypothetical protein IAG44_20390 [Streptomyces roseirectus]|uniref:Uncharacterized protein n=1 Tax=Streptomyces roseirectus TaxID=2768066 RepID=A0A7H0IFI6_9ACTN|nr:hypothetical protein [Streptomyces roseirectus]QNP71552.1 hypothetical protein IAG44_20390 [Streptomyces roseirectus]
MSEPVVTASERARVEYHTFHLADAGQHDQPSFRPENGLIFSRPGLAVVVVGSNSGVVNLTVEVHAQPVAHVETEEWDEVLDHSVQSLSGQMRISSLMNEPADLPVLTPYGPGPYRVRVHARGRDRAGDAHTAEPLEDYLLQIWPGPAEPDLVHKRSDRYGESLREAASNQPEEPSLPASEETWRSKASARLRRHDN